VAEQLCWVRHQCLPPQMAAVPALVKAALMVAPCAEAAVLM
jgi:hypothetical protein